MKARFEFLTDVSYQQYLRIYLSAMAMQGLLASCDISNNPLYDFEYCAKGSIDYADALINELNKKP